MWAIEVMKPLLQNETCEAAAERIKSQDRRAVLVRAGSFAPAAIYKLEPQPSDELGVALMQTGDLYGTGARVIWLDDSGLLLEHMRSGDATEVTKQFASHLVKDQADETSYDN